MGFGEGGLVVLDAKTGEKREEIPLAAHPESFQLDRKDSRIFVNEPGSFQIAVIDRRSGTELARWEAAGAAANFPMAFDAASERLFVAYRVPALITMFHTKTGELIARLPTCGDSDDVFYDAKRSRVYVICGQGEVQTFAKGAGGLAPIDTTPTSPGARTGLFLPTVDRLAVAARAAEGRTARLLILRPGDAR